MKSCVKELRVSTSAREELLDITDSVQRLVQESQCAEGYCIVFVSHTTAGITINENADPDVRRDMLHVLQMLVPPAGDYRHREGNSAAHVKASLMGSSHTVLIREGSLKLGTWQGIFFAEFDGPRTRAVWVRIIPT